ncbi:hypothetical protein COCNU_10G008640 [Cocos nucifera]|uniref:Uncharacterized protein n=1 Tax=Cocos nucifera TaxID=13894 RepID=A0A8K0IMG5_COCNU|nr:hypothetical protein COCNU_10G008640 [Cocos nucifera]
MHGLFSFSNFDFFFVEMTPEERKCLAKEIKSLKRKDSSVRKILKKARTDKLISIVLIQVAPIPEADVAASTLTLPQEDAHPVPPEQCEVVEKKKKTKDAVRKKIRRMAENSSVGALLIFPFEDSRSLPNRVLQGPSGGSSGDRKGLGQGRPFEGGLGGTNYGGQSPLRGIEERRGGFCGAKDGLDSFGE